MKPPPVFCPAPQALDLLVFATPQLNQPEHTRYIKAKVIAARHILLDNPKSSSLSIRGSICIIVSPALAHLFCNLHTSLVSLLLRLRRERGCNTFYFFFFKLTFLARVTHVLSHQARIVINLEGEPLAPCLSLPRPLPLCSLISLHRTATHATTH